MSEYIHLKIKRQDSPQEPSYWEEFKIPYKPNMNVVSTLMEIRKRPTNSSGQATTPVVWDCTCLEEVCGACTMLINGEVRQACSALIDQLEQPITLAPMTKFKVIRDLQVDRQVMFDHLKKIKAWVNIDGAFDLGRGPRMSEKDRKVAYQLSRCMTCGCCMEACPNVNERSDFMGAAPLGQARLFNLHPLGKMDRHDRLDAVMGKGGLVDCGNSQNCVMACPKNIPLTTSIADLNRQTTLHSFARWFNK